jgi:hypothetical protein
MKKLFLALGIALISMSVMAQTEDEYVRLLTEKLEPLAVNDLVCGSVSATVRVQNQKVTIEKSSNNPSFDASVFRASKEALSPDFVGYIEFPVVLTKSNGCSEFWTENVAPKRR